MSHLLIVTGGSAGIGRAVLAAAPADSHRVAVSRTDPQLPGVAHHPADLAEPDAWSALGDELERLVASRTWQRVSFVHAAGTLTPIGFQGEVDHGEQAANVLLDAACPLVLGHRFLAAVRHLEVPRELVVLSSGAARTDYPGWATYGAAKAAVDRWVSTVAAEQAERGGERGGVRVRSVAPGVVATGMQSLIRSTDERDFPRVERFRRLYAEGELADPDDVAAALWALLDDPDATEPVVDLRRR